MCRQLHLENLCTGSVCVCRQVYVRLLQDADLKGKETAFDLKQWRHGFLGPSPSGREVTRFRVVGRQDTTGKLTVSWTAVFVKTCCRISDSDSKTAETSVHFLEKINTPFYADCVAESGKKGGSEESAPLPKQ